MPRKRCVLYTWTPRDSIYNAHSGSLASLSTRYIVHPRRPHLFHAIHGKKRVRPRLPKKQQTPLSCLAKTAHGHQRQVHSSKHHQVLAKLPPPEQRCKNCTRIRIRSKNNPFFRRWHASVSRTGTKQPIPHLPLLTGRHPAFVGVGRVGPVSWLPSPFAFSPDLMWQLKTRSYCTIIAETIFGRADR